MLLFFNCYRISFSFKVSRNYKTSCFLGGLFVRRLTTWISQIIAAKLIQYLLFEVFSLDKLFSVKAQSPSQKCIIFNTFLPLFRLLILPFLIFRDVLCSVRHYLVLCWKIHPTPPPPRLLITDLHGKGKKKKSSSPLFENIDSGDNYQRFSSFDFRWTINHVPSL